MEISDIHLDLFYNSTSPVAYLCRNPLNPNETLNSTADVKPYGRQGCDSPLKLVLTVLDHMEKANPNPKFIIFLGDLVGHDILGYIKTDYDSFFINASSIFYSQLRLRFPETHILPCFGNNDSPTHNEEPTQHFINMLTVHWSAIISQTKMKCDLSKLIIGLYYHCEIVKNLYVILLNTIMWKEYTKTNETLSNLQFQWLNDTLNEISKEKSRRIIIAGHVPPIISTYNQKYLLKQNFSIKLSEILLPFKSQILGSFYGHTHEDEIRIQDGKRCLDQNSCIFESISTLIIHPSVSMSPVERNPSFREYSFRRSDNQLMNYRDHLFDIGFANYENKLIWKSYEFRKSYQKYIKDSSLNLESVKKTLVNIQNSFELTNNFISNRNGMYNKMVSRKKYVLCTMNGSITNREEYAACVNK